MHCAVDSYCLHLILKKSESFLAPLAFCVHLCLRGGTSHKHYVDCAVLLHAQTYL